MGTQRPDGSEIPRGSGALASLTPERTPAMADFVSASIGSVDVLSGTAHASGLGNIPSVGLLTSPPAAEDVIPAMLSVGEVVLTQEQQRNIAEQAGKTPAELFRSAKVPGFDGQTVDQDEPTEKPKSRGERFTRAIGAAAELLGFSKGGKVPGVQIGDMVQWTINGSDQFKEPRKVSQVMGEFALVEGATTGVPISQLFVQTRTERPVRTEPGKAATQPQSDLDWMKQIDEAIQAQDANRQQSEASKPSMDRSQNIAKGIEADGGIMLSEAVPLIASEQSPRERVIQERGMSPAPETPIPRDERFAAGQVDAPRRQRRLEQQHWASLWQSQIPPERMPKSRGQQVIDTLARKFVRRKPETVEPPTITMPMGRAATFPRDLEPPTGRTGLVDPHPEIPRFGRSASTAAQKAPADWNALSTDERSFLEKTQPQLAKQLAAASAATVASSAAMPAPLQGIANQIADLQQRASALQQPPEHNEPTYSLRKPKSRQQQVAEERAAVVSGLLDAGSPRTEDHAPTYGLAGPQNIEPTANSAASERPNERTTVGQNASINTSAMGNLVHTFSRMIGGRTGRGLGLIAQFMGARRYSRQTLGERIGSYLHGSTGSSGGGDGGRGELPNGSDGITSAGMGGGGGRMGRAVTAGLSDGGSVIHVWVDGGQIRIDDTAGGPGPAAATRNARTEATSSQPPAQSLSKATETEADTYLLSSRSPRKTPERPIVPRVPSASRSWLGNLTHGIGRKLRGVGSTGKRLLRFARGVGGRPGVMGATGRLAGSLAGGVGRAAMAGAGRIAMGGIVGGVASGGAAGGAALGAGAALVAGTGPVGLTLAALAGLTAGLISIGKAMGDFAKNANESNRQITAYNGRLSVAFAQLDMGRTLRNLATANATSESGGRLANAVNRLEQRQQPGRVAWNNLQNEAGIAGAEGGRAIAELARLADELGVFKGMKIWLDGAMVPLTVTAEAAKASADAVVWLKEWFAGEPHRKDDRKKRDENELPATIAFAAAISGLDPWKHPGLPGVKQNQQKQQDGGRQPIPPLK